MDMDNTQYRYRHQMKRYEKFVDEARQAQLHQLTRQSPARWEKLKMWITGKLVELRVPASMPVITERNLDEATN